MKKLGLKKLSFLALIFTLAVGLFACSSAKQNSGSNDATKLKVVASLDPEFCLALEHAKSPTAKVKIRAKKLNFFKPNFF